MAMYNARELAMARMRAEADHLAADGIVGVNLRMQMYAWGQSCLEFVATAPRSGGSPTSTSCPTPPPSPPSPSAWTPDRRAVTPRT
ncbi:MAG TPA: heavy metal-binding domain-containing protein [Streptosporangiaceae bacterium]